MDKQKKDLGLYIHIPFCVKKCDYCDFLSAPADENTKKEYVNALIAEINSYKELVADYLVKTIFIGGGTPSSIDSSYISKILEAVMAVFDVSGFSDDGKKIYLNDHLMDENSKPVTIAEISIEANPGTLTKEKLSNYKKAGINRLSIGLQSADNEELKRMGRIHTFEEFVGNYELAREMGFQNINIDLISALPDQTLDKWLDTLQKAIDLNPEHISAYSLIIEEGTPFFDRYKEDDLDEELDRHIYAKTTEGLNEADYHQYEISNFAKPGYECKHNSSYWLRTEYLGIGLGASSLLQNTRFTNEDNLQEYIKLSNNYINIRRNIEELSTNRQMEEFMFLGLRMRAGINTDVFEMQFGKSIESIYGKVLQQSVEEGFLRIHKKQIYLTDKGIDLSNIIMARFLFEE